MAESERHSTPINIANTTTAGAVGGTVFGTTLNPILAATAAGGTYGGLSELSGSVARGDSVLQTVENTARGTAFGTVSGYAGGVMGMGTAGYMAAAGAPILLQVTASGAVAGISSGATHRALAGQDTTPEAVAMDGLYGSVSALTFYGTGLAYERVTAPKLPNTYIRDRLAAAEEMGRSEGCEETYYRTMSQADYDYLRMTGELPSTGETFISPTELFSSDYDGVLIEFKLNDGTTNSLLEIGVGNNSGQVIRDYGTLPQVTAGWTERYAFFKGEGIQTNIGLGQGKALEIFNSNITNFKEVRGN